MLTLHVKDSIHFNAYVRRFETEYSRPRDLAPAEVGLTADSWLWAELRRLAELSLSQPGTQANLLHLIGGLRILTGTPGWPDVANLNVASIDVDLAIRIFSQFDEAITAERLSKHKAAAQSQLVDCRRILTHRPH